MEAGIVSVALNDSYLHFVKVRLVMLNFRVRIVTLVDVVEAIIVEVVVVIVSIVETGLHSLTCVMVIVTNYFVFGFINISILVPLVLLMTILVFVTVVSKILISYPT